VAANLDLSFILHHVAPKMASKLGNDVAIVLGKALMWGAFSQPVESEDEGIMTKGLTGIVD
jgi:hypothetical protein